MGFNTDEKVSWSDIQALYNNLNSARQKFTLTTVTVPTNPGTAVPSNVKDLNDYVNAMSSISFLTNVAVTGVIVPSRGEPLRGEPFTSISDTIDKILDTCPHDASFRGSGFNASFRSGFNASFCGDHRGGFFFGFGGHGSFTCGSFGGSAGGNSGCYGFRT